eukprot:TRINITY_DN8097_c0_g2_i2.p1 TRINITY_DN8097_c0_g2~~TRINITY_DN8097_c0_g2_i2.p1  ORF type:complete len:245 (+),score=46.49 TRINITY_DN8097_c0_g2_i2:206-940(+)
MAVTKIDFSIRGIDERFHITIDKGLFLDVGNNDLRRRVFEVPAMRHLILSTAVEGAGIAFSGLAYATFIVTVGINPFKSKPSFWIFMSMIQMLSFVPVLDCQVPGTLEFILTSSFGVSKSSVPFEALPSWVPNPKTFIAKFETEPLNSRFDNAGYTSISFIYNFSDQLGTWIILVLLYFVIGFAGKTLPKFLYLTLTPHRKKFATKYQNNYKYNALLRLLIVNYLSMSFCSLTNFSKVLSSITL